MVQIADLSLDKLCNIADREGVRYEIGPFNIELQTDIPELVSVFSHLYAPLSLLENKAVYDFHVRMKRPYNFHRWWHPQAIFSIDSVYPFEPYPRNHAFPLFEWGLNWCIAVSAHQYVMLHSAVLEYKNRALILPAQPGSGKSTLCAALMLRGWRLLSDEFGLVEPETTQLLPLPRAIPLKNESISVIKDFHQDGVMGPVFPKTRKGDIAHLAPTPSSLELQHKRARPALVVFPQYTPDVRCELERLDNNEAFTRVTDNSFNYKLTQSTGFHTLAGIIKQSDCYAVKFNDLDSTISLLTELMEEKVAV